jgi:predicted nucleic acid-binding protein
MNPTDTVEIVLDTNVLLDWLVFRNPVTGALQAELDAGRLRWTVSAPMLQELGYVLTPALLARWQVEPEAPWQTVRRYASEVAAPEPLGPGRRLRCSDRDDQIFIDLALTRRCRWLLTRDRALLKLARRALLQGVTVLTPEAWRATLPTETPPSSAAASTAPDTSTVLPA